MCEGIGAAWSVWQATGCAAVVAFGWGNVGKVAADLNAQERQELIELLRKLRQVQMERDILAKATAWFAGKSEKTFTPSTNS